ncbi:MAG: 50S ribosomal protein L32 [Verrucomicrobiota bacterium]|nr:50S ribosomal protein L32 [Verrucomicrobiota bacterium]
MPVPKRKTSRPRRRKRQASNSAVTLPQLSSCPQCDQPHIPHRVCPACGFYKGRRYLSTTVGA